MKRVTILFCALALLLCGCGAQVQPTQPTLTTVQPTAAPTTAAPTQPTTVLPSVFPTQAPAAAPAEFRGVWLPYMELNPQNIKTPEAYQTYLASVFAPLQRLGTTDLFVQVRPFGDAIYPSARFPSAACAAGTRGGALPFDFLAAVLAAAQPFGFRVHAWINPYRLASTPQAPAAFQSDPVVGPWLAEPGQTDVIFLEGGVYLNPASARVQALVADGVHELLDNYAIAGVHLDDYFYPTAADSFDAASYDFYRAQGGTLARGDWRKENVNTLLKTLYAAVKAKNAALVFSVSPAGNINNNETELFADVRRWCRESGFCDMILPQIYFGFQNAAQPFLQCLSDWCALCANGPVKLIVGLAVYKIGEADPYAGAQGEQEWIADQTVLRRQVAAVRAAGCAGFCAYSAKFVNFHETLCAEAFQTDGSVV